MASLNEVLLKEGLISRDQLQDAQDKQVGAKKPLQELLVEMGFISEDVLIQAVSRAFDTPLMSANDVVDPLTVKLVPFDIVRKLGVFPVYQKNSKLILAMTNPVDVVAIDTVSSLTNMQVEPVLVSRSRITKLFEENYQVDDTVYDLLKNTSSDIKISLLKDGVRQKSLPAAVPGLEENSSVIRLVDVILNDAVKMRASDIHVEPQEGCSAVRYRIDGYLKNIMNVSKELQPRFTARIKVLAGLDVAEQRKAQDGRIEILVNDRKVDLRISIIPTFYGEKVAMRLLDHREVKVSLDKIGLNQEEMLKFTHALKKTQGMILVTGPTGSGKTSTLYAALNYVKNETRHIITIEDPIEYLIEGINQIQLNPVKDMTFATSLRSILRQDPNIIFVGEIRDKEAARIAFQAAQTGHLVFSTLHTTNSVSSVSRLLDIGLEPYLISSSLIMVIAQRLVRLICPHCKEEYMPDAGEIERYRALIEPAGLTRFYRGRGCQECNFSGFLGRTGIFEIMEVNDSIRKLINDRVSEIGILQEARKNGLITLADSALGKVAEGLTTIEEVLRVVDILPEEKTAEMPQVAPIEEKPAAALRPASLLIVDDEEDLLIPLGQRLEMSGYKIIKAYNGLEAVEKAYREHPDLIIMDVNMPQMDGFAATKALRSKLATASIPIMLLTARQDKTSELTGLDAGADDYLVKPYDKDKLLARVKMLLRKR